jgi:hypothetical protein
MYRTFHPMLTPRASQLGLHAVPLPVPLLSIHIVLQRGKTASSGWISNARVEKDQKNFLPK